MKLKMFKSTEKVALLRYEATYTFSHESMLDFMQGVRDDFGNNIQLFQAVPEYGKKETNLPRPYSLYLHDVRAFDSAKGISIAGKSRILDLELRITVYEDKKIVDVQIPFEQEKSIVELIDNNNLFDQFFDMWEISCYARSSMRYSINMTLDFIEERINGGTGEKENILRAQCNGLGMGKRIENLPF